MSTPAFRNPLMPRSILRPSRGMRPRLEPPAPPAAPPAPPPPQPPTMSETDAARYVNVSVAWLRKSRCMHFREVMDGPTFVRLGIRRVAYLRTDLDAWLANHRQQLGRPDVNFTEPAREQGASTSAGDGPACNSAQEVPIASAQD